MSESGDEHARCGREFSFREEGTSDAEKRIRKREVELYTTGQPKVKYRAQKIPTREIRFEK